MVARSLVHVRLKCTRRNARHKNIVLNKLRRQTARQMDDGGFRCLIAIGLPRVDAQAIDRCDVNDLAGAIKCRGCLQLRMQGLRQKEQGFDVQVHHTVPASFRELAKIRAPCCARIVHENIDLFLTLGNLRGKRQATVHGRQVARQADDLTAKFGDGFLNLVDLTCADIHACCAGLEIAFDDHLADAARSARDQRHAAIEVE